MIIGLGIGIGFSNKPGVSAPAIQLSANSIAEGASGRLVGTLSVSSGSGSYTFSITADPDNKFAIDGDDLETDAALNYEAATSHSVTIEADNGVDDPISRTFTINVTNVIEAPVFASAPVVTGDLDGILTCSTGTLEQPDGAGATFAYQWKDADDDSDLTGETDNTLDSQDYIGLEVYCDVTATNSADSATASSNTVGPLEDAALVPQEIGVVGHSLVDGMFPFFNNLLPSGGHAYRHSFPGAPLADNWTATVDENTYDRNVRTMLGDGVLDHVILTQAGPIVGYMDVTVDDFMVWYDHGKANNPSVGVWFYWIWPFIPDWETTPDWAAWLTLIEEDAERFDTLTQLINLESDPTRVYAMPCGPAMAALYDAIENEEITGLTDMADIFIDDIHLSEIGGYFIGLVHWAVIHGRSPVGLSWEISASVWEPNTIDGLTEAMAADLQALAWEVVSAHPMAGVAAWVPWVAPPAFEVGDWAATGLDGQINIAISSLPSGFYGPDITDIEYRLDGGSWVSSGGVVGFNITGVSNDTEYDVELRAVNLIGASVASDTKAATPTEGSSLETGLVLHLEFEEGTGTDAADSSPEGNDATLLSGTSWSTVGSLPAVAIGAEGQGVNVPRDASLEPTSAISFAFFHRRANAWHNYGRMLSKEGANTGYRLRFDDSGLIEASLGTGSAEVVLTASAPEDTNPHHYGVTFDGTTARLYIDGVEVDDASYSGSLAHNTSADMGLGAYPDGAGANIGRIAQVRVYSRALSLGEIEELAGV